MCVPPPRAVVAGFRWYEHPVRDTVALSLTLAGEKWRMGA